MTTEIIEPVTYKTRYCRWKDVPETLTTKTQYGKLGYKLIKNAVPKSEFYSCAYRKTYALYEKTDFVEKIKRKPPTLKQYSLTKELIAEALYIVNKHAKIKNELYLIKDEVLEICKELNYIDKYELHSSRVEDRKYVLFKDYSSEMGYYSAINDPNCWSDEYDRPFFQKDTNI